MTDFDPRILIANFVLKQLDTVDGSTELAADADGTVEKTEEGTSEENDGEEDNQVQNPSFPGAAGFNGANGGFTGMGLGGNFDQMQMMMAMQNGMMPNGFSFPMMGSCSNFRSVSTSRNSNEATGMPGMNMDPMTMQMYMGGGFQGMGMNNMSLNAMGMGGFGDEAASNNNWNGQQSWNVGQDNFNHPNASGMGSADYGGSFNASGFQTGYNQGNYGHQNQYNDYRGNQYRGGFRGRGRGRGYFNGGYGYGRGGGYNQNYGSGYQDQNFGGQYQNGHAQNDQQQGNGGETESNVDEFGRSIRTDPSKDGDGEANVSGQREKSQAAESGRGSQGPRECSTTADNGTNKADSNSHPQQPADDILLIAPKGPKAMLQGLPNTSYRHLQARGWVGDGNKPSTPTTAGMEEFPSPADDGQRQPSETPSRGGSRARDTEAYRERDKGGDWDEGDGGRDQGYEQHSSSHNRQSERERQRDRSRSAESRSRSRSGEHKESHRRSRRHRSYSLSDEHSGDERRHRRHRRKHSAYVDEKDAKVHSSRDQEPNEDRSRSVSPDPQSRRSGGGSGHRSSRKGRDSDSKRRDRDKDRDRDRHRDRDRDGERERDRDRASRKSSHRSRRDRDYEKSDRDRDRDRKDRDKDRDRRDRDRDRDRDRRHRSSKTTNEVSTPVDESFSVPSARRSSRGSLGFDIKGLATAVDSSRRSSVATTPATGSTSADPHAAERAARDRERLLKETRRMASLTSLAGAKRSRGAEEAGNDSRRSSRRKGRGGEVVAGDESEEERMRRLEAERERERYD